MAGFFLSFSFLKHGKVEGNETHKFLFSTCPNLFSSGLLGVWKNVSEAGCCCICSFSDHPERTFIPSSMTINNVFQQTFVPQVWFFCVFGPTSAEPRTQNFWTLFFRVWSHKPWYLPVRDFSKAWHSAIPDRESWIQIFWKSIPLISSVTTTLHKRLLFPLCAFQIHLVSARRPKPVSYSQQHKSAKTFKNESPL